MRARLRLLRECVAALDTSMLALFEPFPTAEAERRAVLLRRIISRARDDMVVFAGYIERVDAQRSTRAPSALGVQHEPQIPDE